MQSYTEPLELLKTCVGNIIHVRLRNNTKINGKLIAYDEHMNLMLKDTDILKDQTDRTIHKKLMYLRGDSVKLVGHS